MICPLKDFLLISLRRDRIVGDSAIFSKGGSAIAWDYDVFGVLLKSRDACYHIKTTLH